MTRAENPGRELRTTAVRGRLVTFPSTNSYGLFMQNRPILASPSMERRPATGPRQDPTAPSTPVRWLAPAVAALGSSCAFLHGATPIEHAHDVLPKCDHVTSELTAYVLSKESIQSVEPAFSYRITGNDHVMLLRGALIHLRPAPGATQELVQLALECHQARAALGEIAPPNDPYVLPGKWADIDVSSDGAMFEILVSADSFDDRKALLDRARTYRTAPAARPAQ